LSPLLNPLLLAAAAPAVAAARAEARRLAWRGALLLCAIGVAIIGIGFAALAAYRALALDLGEPKAAAIIAGSLLILASALVLAEISIGRHRRLWHSVPQHPPGVTSAEVAAIALALQAKAGEKLQANSVPLTIAALAAGAAIGYSPALRDALLGLVGLSSKK
jgi:predicted RNA methylase